MKATMILGAGLAAMGFLAGCATPIPPGAERGPDRTMAYNVRIDASDPGVKIEANGEYIGTTPLTLKIFGDPDGTFHDFGSYYYVIKANPTGTNEFVQTKVYRTGHLLTPEDHIPNHIYFDMNQPPPPTPPAVYYYGYPEPPPYYYYEGPPVFFGPRIYIGPRFHRRW